MKKTLLYITILLSPSLCSASLADDIIECASTMTNDTDVISNLNTIHEFESLLYEAQNEISSDDEDLSASSPALDEIGSLIKRFESNQINKPCSKKFIIEGCQHVLSSMLELVQLFEKDCKIDPNACDEEDMQEKQEMQEMQEMLERLESIKRVIEKLTAR